MHWQLITKPRLHYVLGFYLEVPNYEGSVKFLVNLGG